MGFAITDIGESAVTFKKTLNRTSWAGQLVPVVGMIHRYCDGLRALNRITVETSTKDERDDALRIFNSMQFKLFY